MRRPLRFSISVDGLEIASLIKDGVLADRLGYDFVWMADHVSDIPPGKAVFETWTTLAFLGAKTKNVMLASGVTDTQRVHPAKMASTVATLDHLTGGRAALGIGAGEVMNVKPYGMEWESTDARIARVTEYIKVVHALWSSSFEAPVSFDGRWYALDRAHMSVGPLRRPRPPVYIGAFASNSMLRIVGALADGWFPGALFTPKAFGEKVRLIREAARAAGRKPGNLDLLVNIPVVFGDDRRMRERIKNAFRGSLVKNRYMLKLLGADEAYDYVSKSLQYQLISPTPEDVQRMEKIARSLPIPNDVLERALDDMMAVGSWDDCVESLRRFVKAGATQIHVSTFMANQETYKTFARKVMPALRQR